MGKGKRQAGESRNSKGGKKKKVLKSNASAAKGGGILLHRSSAKGERGGDLRLGKRGDPKKRKTTFSRTLSEASKGRGDGKKEGEIIQREDKTKNNLLGRKKNVLR